MKTRRVVYSDAASDDLDDLAQWLAELTSPYSAIEIVIDLEDFIDGLAFASERGTPRDDLSLGVRVIPHKRAVLAVYVTDETITVARIFYGGQDWEAALRKPGG